MKVFLIPWTRWFAWRPVRLQIKNRLVWLCWIEYEQIRIPIYTAFGGRVISGIVTHYRHCPKDTEEAK